MARTLHLPLKREYFEAIRDGQKPDRVDAGLSGQGGHFAQD